MFLFRSFAEHKFFEEWFPKRMLHSSDLKKLFDKYLTEEQHMKTKSITDNINQGTVKNVSLVALSLFVHQHPLDGLPMHLDCNSRTASVKSLTEKIKGQSVRDVALQVKGINADKANFSSQSIAVLPYNIAPMTESNKNSKVKPVGMVSIDLKSLDDEILGNVKLIQDLVVGTNVDRESILMILVIFNYPPKRFDLFSLLESLFNCLEEFDWENAEFVRRLFVEESRLGVLFEGIDVASAENWQLYTWLSNTLQMLSPFRLSVPEGLHRVTAACIFSRGYDIAKPFPQDNEMRAAALKPRPQLYERVQVEYWYRADEKPIEELDTSQLQTKSGDIQENRERVVATPYRTFFNHVSKRIDISDGYQNLPAESPDAEGILALGVDEKKAALKDQRDMPFFIFERRSEPFLLIFWECCMTINPMKSTIRAEKGSNKPPDYNGILRDLKMLQNESFFSLTVCQKE